MGRYIEIFCRPAGQLSLNIADVIGIAWLRLGGARSLVSGGR